MHNILNPARWDRYRSQTPYLLGTDGSGRGGSSSKAGSKDWLGQRLGSPEIVSASIDPNWALGCDTHDWERNGERLGLLVFAQPGRIPIKKNTFFFFKKKKKKHM